jgi:NADP-dependent aldehyde dehydrogenase
MSSAATATFRAVDPTTGAEVGPEFRDATPAEVAAAVEAAVAAHRELRTWDGARLAGLLRACADELEADGEALVATAALETGLPATPRLTGELARTCGQLRLFADDVATGAHLDVIIDHADPTAVPPRPDLRRMRVGVGPVAVFGASNFPLAFSVPGGDTASALAAGCPVAIKAHPSHPATSERAFAAMLRGCERVGAPAGTVGLVHGAGHAVGAALVTAPGVRAVGFTGSTGGGLALARLAAARPVPIPVHAEMGSVNPVLVTAAALAARGPALAEALAASLLLGTGQFCTSPGLVVLPPGVDGDAFVAALASTLGAGAGGVGGVGASAGVLLNRGVRAALDAHIAATRAVPGVRVVVDGAAGAVAGAAGAGVAGAGPIACAPSMFEVDLDTWLASDQLREEHFGPVAIAVRADEARWGEVLAALPGQLTVTVHSEAGDHAGLAALRDDLAAIAGRVLFAGVPTGVAVTAAQHHGGPFPATTDGRFTSVGTRAIERWLRPVAFQDAPAALLPAELQEDNPLGVPRLVDGVRER